MSRRRIPEAANHAAKDPRGIWGELHFVPDGRRSVYWVSRRYRGGWVINVWHRWVPRTHHQVRPAGMFDRRG
jgi:hypothetical protein